HISVIFQGDSTTVGFSRENRHRCGEERRPKQMGDGQCCLPRGSASLVSRSSSQAVQHFLPLFAGPLDDSHVDAAATDCRRCIDFLAKLVLSDKLKLRWAGLEDKCLARLVRGEEILADENQRSSKGAAKALLPQLLSRE